jgi:glycosyltransferase involved in cell wall biosynthesis
MDNIYLVSVIIPTYNRLAYFKIALQSALRQTYKNIEVIVTDDSTTDEIEEYVVGIHDRRVKYFRNKNRLGIALNTRNGISKSSGQYFSFLNDDDFWIETFIERLVLSTHENDKIACVFSDHWLVDNNGNLIIKESDQNTINYKRNELKTGIVPDEKRNNLFVDFTVPIAMASMIRKDIIDINNYPEEIGGAYDRWLLLQCVTKKEYHFFYVNEKLTNYRVHNQSVSATQGVTVAKSVIYILDRSRSVLSLEDPQMISINKEIRVYIRSLLKKKSLFFIKYIPLYLNTFIVKSK